jgi:hypothetical protein
MDLWDEWLFETNKGGQDVDISATTINPHNVSMT